MGAALWAIGAVALFFVWRALGFALLVAIGGYLLPAYGPEQAPLWLAYSALVVETFCWSLALLLITRRLDRLNRALVWVLSASAVLYVLQAAMTAFHPFPGVVEAAPVMFGRHLADAGTPAHAAVDLLGAILTALAVGVAGWTNKRIQRAADTAEPTREARCRV